MNNITKRAYRADLDLLKAIAIISVVLYHMGCLPSGYLGVDVFLVINGYFVIPPLLRNELDVKGLITWNLKRLFRLYPLVLIASAVCLLVGYWGMLPDYYENLAQSVFATDLYANNILQAITTKNYWDVVNDFKPLMHTWYLGIVVQFYLFYSTIVFLSGRFSRLINVSLVKLNLGVLFSLTLVSMALYLSPQSSDVSRFYYLPWRFFEMGIGGIIGYYFVGGTKKLWNPLLFIWIFVLFLLFSGWLPIPHKISYNAVSGTVIESATLIPKFYLLLFTVITTCFIVSMDNMKSSIISILSYQTHISYLGKMTLSVFIWHQVVLAFIRLYYGEVNNLLFHIMYLIFVLLLSSLSFTFIEKRIRMTKISLSATFIALLALLGISFSIYVNAGVVRDVPELRLKYGQTHRGMFAEYCDRAYDYDKDFLSNRKKNVLVEGVSFGRDFVNVLLESNIADSINISYIFDFDPKYENRYKNADVLFLFCDRPDVPNYVVNSIKPTAKMIGIGPKNFGPNNSQIYCMRNKPDYFNKTVRIDQGFRILNKRWKDNWGEHYVDMIAVVEQADGSVRIFTDDHAFISQDSRHLTQDGARFYAKKLINETKGRKRYGLD